MRCSCKECGVYMVQAESDHLGCVCPDCGYRCNDCLGTDTVVSRDSLRALASPMPRPPPVIRATLPCRLNADRSMMFSFFTVSKLIF